MTDERLINDDLLIMESDGRTYGRTTLVVKSLSRLKNNPGPIELDIEEINLIALLM